MLHRIRLRKSDNIALDKVASYFSSKLRKNNINYFSQIQQFSYQIRMLSINISGWGFFQIDYLFLCDVRQRGSFSRQNNTSFISILGNFIDSIVFVDGVLDEFWKLLVEE